MKFHSEIASNIAWRGIGNGLALLIGFASSILLARWLGLESRGIYALVLVTSNNLASFLGVHAWGHALAFFTGKQRYLPSQVAGHAIFIVLISASVMALSLLLLPTPILELIFSGLQKVHLWMIVLVTVSTLLFTGLTNLLTGLNLIPLYTTISLGKAVIALVLQFILLGALNMGLTGAYWELVISAIVTLCVTTAIFARKSGIDLRIKRNFLKDIVAYSGKSYPGHLGIVLLSRVDIYFVAVFSGVEAVGFYAIAKGLTDIIAIIEQSISNGVMPNVIAADHSGAANIIARAFRVSFWLSGLFLLIGAASAGWLIPLLYGDEFSGAAPVFILLLPGALLLTTRTLGMFFSMQMGRPEIPTYYILASGLISLPVSYFLTRQFGYLGAAAAFSIIASLRGIVAIGLFVVFSRLRIRDVLLIDRADLLLLSRIIRPWLNGRTPREQQT